MRGEREKLEAMAMKAAESLATKIRDSVLVDSYRALLQAGWDDADIRKIQDEALESCKLES